MRKTLQEIKGGHVYYNGSFTNNSSIPVQAQLNVRLTQPLLSQASDYKMSIIRWTIAGFLIPIMIFPTAPNPVFEISIGYNNQFYTVDVPFIPYIVDTPTTAPYYYNVFGYQDFIAMVNTGIYTAFNAFKTAVSGFGGTYAPYLTIAEGTDLISIFFETAYWDPNAIPTPPSPYPSLYFNGTLFNLFQSFPSYVIPVNATSPDPTQVWYEINCYSQGGLSTSSSFVSQYLRPPNYLNYGSTPPMSIVGESVTQDYACLNSWVQAREIVITSSTLPVKTEYYPSTQLSDPGNVNFRSVISDYSLNIEKSADIRSIISYVPLGERRWSDLTNSLPLQQIDFQFWWIDSQLAFHPVMLSQGSNCNIKFLFQS